MTTVPSHLNARKKSPPARYNCVTPRVQTILSRLRKRIFSKFPNYACVIEHSIFALQLFVPTFLFLMYYNTSLIITLRFQDISLFLEVSFSVPNLSFILSFDLLLFCVYTVDFKENILTNSEREKKA